MCNKFVINMHIFIFLKGIITVLPKSLNKVSMLKPVLADVSKKARFFMDA